MDVHGIAKVNGSWTTGTVHVRLIPDKSGARSRYQLSLVQPIVGCLAGRSDCSQQQHMHFYFAPSIGRLTFESCKDASYRMPSCNGISFDRNLTLESSLPRGAAACEMHIFV